MHISVEKAPFLKVLGHGQSVVEKKTTVPIISTVLLHAVDGQLSVTATDMDMALIERIPVEVKVAGSVCVSASLLHDIVKKLNDKKVIDLTVSDDGSRLIWVVCLLKIFRSLFKVKSRIVLRCQHLFLGTL